MDIKKIQDLIKAVNKSDLNELCVKEGDFELQLKKAQPEKEIVTISASAPAAVQTAAEPTPSVSAPQPAETKTEASTENEQSDGNSTPIKSPMIGTFYRSEGPDKPAYVSIGDKVEKGQVVCIVEAMKLFNEIESEVSGKIVKVLVDDSSPVEYDQPLFLVEPA